MAHLPVFSGPLEVGASAAAVERVLDAAFMAPAAGGCRSSTAAFRAERCPSGAQEPRSLLLHVSPRRCREEDILGLEGVCVSWRTAQLGLGLGLGIPGHG